MRLRLGWSLGEGGLQVTNFPRCVGPSAGGDITCSWGGFGVGQPGRQECGVQAGSGVPQLCVGVSWWWDREWSLHSKGIWAGVELSTNQDVTWFSFRSQEKQWGSCFWSFSLFTKQKQGGHCIAVVTVEQAPPLQTPWAPKVCPE